MKLQYCLLIVLFLGCCVMEYRITESSISIYYRNQEKLFPEIYPVWNTNNTYARILVDTLIQINFEHFNIGKCDAGLKNGCTTNLTNGEFCLATIQSEEALQAYNILKDRTLLEWWSIKPHKKTRRGIKMSNLSYTLKNSFQYKGKLYPMQEKNSITID